MISDLSIAIVENAPMPLVPVVDVCACLESRRPQPRWQDEQPLFITLPSEIRRDVKLLQSAAEIALNLVKSGSKVRPACAAVLAMPLFARRWNAKTFRNLFDKWRKSKDWVALVNRSKAGALWQDREDGLPEPFLDYCAARIGQYKRDDSRREALRSIKRQWLTGRTMSGQREPIPGYGFKEEWLAANAANARGDVPKGWTLSNISRQLKARNTLPSATRALLLQGTAAAKEFVPQVRVSRADLRFMEHVQFDDVKTDWRIFDPRTGQPMDLWLLIARDLATTMLLGFGMRPARAREDGSQEHLKLRDMKQLCGWLLERYGLPPYEMIWKIERGTATLSEGSKRAIEELLPGRIRISYSSMIGGTSPAGYFERRIGNSKGKASLESHNRGMHLIGAALPGQTGPHYAARPADLAAREKECQEIALLSEFLPEHLRGQLGYSLLDVAQAREHLFKIFTFQNSRDDHALEGFGDVIEWWDGNVWRPQNTAPMLDVKLRKRREMPIERAARLVSGHMFTPVSPEIITAFYEHTARPVRIEPNGEIEFSHENRKLYFANPQRSPRLGEGAKLLAYFHPDDPAFLHLTDGKGGIVGTWVQRNRIKSNDAEAIAQAIAHQARAMKAAREHADALNAPERAALDEMRARNAQLLESNSFVDVASASNPQSAIRNAPLSSPVAAGLAATKKQTAAAKQAQADEAELAAQARKSLLEGM